MSKAKIYYHDIGDYRSREEKLSIVKKFGTVCNPAMQWKTLHPNDHGDWISQRNESFDKYFSIEPEKKFDSNPNSYFTSYSLGIATARDAWVYNFSSDKLQANLERTIKFYNEQRCDYQIALKNNNKLDFDEFCSNDAEYISWNDSLRNLCSKNTNLNFQIETKRIGLYRPFCKNHLYFEKSFIQRPYQQPKLFPNKNFDNKAICVSGLGGTKENSTIMTNFIPDLNCLDAGSQCFPLYYYEERQKQSRNLFDADESDGEFIRRDGVSDFILERAKSMYGKNVEKEDIFYYVYGFLHCPEYREKFANDLKKMLPRLPLVEDVRDFWAFSKAGRKLADLHINYEKVPPLTEVSVSGAEALSFLDTEPVGSNLYRVEKMRFPKKDQKGTIHYNSKITVSNIPGKAYEYVVNGKSAIEWIMERYQITTHKESGIRNDPNDWAKEVGNPRYILDLLLSIINVSVQSVDIVKGLPKVKFE